MLGALAQARIGSHWRGARGDVDRGRTMAATTTRTTMTAGGNTAEGRGQATAPTAGASGALVSRRAHLAGLGSAAAVALAALPGPGAGAADGPGADPAVITDWNATAVGTIVTDAGKGGGEAFLSLGFAQAAVYNAVNGITRRYELYKWDVDGPPGASPQAAAAAAANRVLLTYFGSPARGAGAAGGRLRRVAGQGRGRGREAAGGPLRRARGGPHPRAPGRRRPDGGHQLHHAPGAGRLAPDAAGDGAVLHPVAGDHAAPAAHLRAAMRWTGAPTTPTRAPGAPRAIRTAPSAPAAARAGAPASPATRPRSGRPGRRR